MKNLLSKSILSAIIYFFIIAGSSISFAQEKKTIAVFSPGDNPTFFGQKWLISVNQLLIN